MLIRRCAWHREFHGYTLIHGVAAWRGFSVKFTDGVCRGCATRVRIEWRVAGRHPEAASPWTLSLAPGGLRRATLVAGFVLLLATALPASLISERLLRDAPDADPAMQSHEAPREIWGPPALVSRAEVGRSWEAAPPRVSRHRSGPAATTTAPAWRRRTIRPAASNPAPVMTSAVTRLPSAPLMRVAEPAPGEEPLTAPRPVQVASVTPTLSRLGATEDEFSRRVRRASMTRLSLSPPLERPRHAGLTVQTP